MNLNSAKTAYEYAAYIKGAFPDGERIIATSSTYSYMYAMNILKGKFELGEEAILTSVYAYAYVHKYLTNFDR